MRRSSRYRPAARGPGAGPPTDRPRTAHHGHDGPPTDRGRPLPTAHHGHGIPAPDPPGHATAGRARDDAARTATATAAARYSQTYARRPSARHGHGHGPRPLALPRDTDRATTRDDGLQRAVRHGPRALGLSHGGPLPGPYRALQPAARYRPLVLAPDPPAGPWRPLQRALRCDETAISLHRHTLSRLTLETTTAPA
jgi:hypothetical protein